MTSHLKRPLGIFQSTDAKEITAALNKVHS